MTDYKIHKEVRILEWCETVNMQTAFVIEIEISNAVWIYTRRKTCVE